MLNDFLPETLLLVASDDSGVDRSIIGLSFKADAAVCKRLGLAGDGSEAIGLRSPQSGGS